MQVLSDVFGSTALVPLLLLGFTISCFLSFWRFVKGYLLFKNECEKKEREKEPYDS